MWKARFGWAEAEPATLELRRLLGCSHQDEGGSHGTASELSQARVAWMMLELAAAETWDGELDAAALHLQEALVTARSLRHRRLEGAALAQEALVDVCAGSIRPAVVAAQECLQLEESPGAIDETQLGRAHLALAWASFHRLDAGTANSELAMARGVSAAALDPLMVVLGTILRARLLADEGRTEEGIGLLSGHLVVPAPVPHFVSHLVAMAKAELAVLVDDQVELAEQVDVLEKAGYGAESALFGALRAARDGEVQRPIDDLTKLLAEPLPNPVVRAAVASARLALMVDSGDLSAARTELPHVLSLVAPHRLLGVLWLGSLAGEAFTDLLYQEVEREDAHPFAVEALAALRAVRRPPRASGDRRRRPGPPGHPQIAQPPAEPVSRDGGRVAQPDGRVLLTPRESEVLGQLSLGGSYGDIARALYVTENTVKTHLASIYRKFGVERRAEALEVARNLGFVGTPVIESDRTT